MRWRCGTRTLEVRLKYARGAVEVCSKKIPGSLEMRSGVTSLGKVTVRSRYARSTVGVRFKYSVGTVPLQFGTVTFFVSNCLRLFVVVIYCYHGDGSGGRHVCTKYHGHIRLLFW